MDGIYTAYLSGSMGNTLGIFAFYGDVICGADVGGGTYKGKYSVSHDGNFAEAELTFSLKDGGLTITGASSDLPASFDVAFRLNLPIEDQNFHLIKTDTGTVHIRFEKRIDL
jgi:hypothetical protein